MTPVVAVLAVALGQAAPPKPLGLTVAAGGILGGTVGPTSTVFGLRAPLEVGATIGVTERTAVRVAGRVSLPSPELGWQLFAGIRNHFGDTFKTFFDADLQVTVNPSWAVGIRAGFGVQYEVASVVGLYASAGIQAGLGPAGGLIAFEIVVGAQFRTYVLPW